MNTNQLETCVQSDDEECVCRGTKKVVQDDSAAMSETPDLRLKTLQELCSARIKETFPLSALSAKHLLGKTKN